MVADRQLGVDMWTHAERSREKFFKRGMKTNEGKLNEKARDHVIDTILSRKLFNYGTRNLCHYFFVCVWCRSKKTLKSSQIYYKHLRLN